MRWSYKYKLKNSFPDPKIGLKWPKKQNELLPWQRATYGIKNVILFTCTPRPFHPQSIQKINFLTVSKYVNYLPELTLKSFSVLLSNINQVVMYMYIDKQLVAQEESLWLRAHGVHVGIYTVFGIEHTLYTLVLVHGISILLSTNDYGQEINAKSNKN